ncbi:hypothetical protein GALL_507210 [mine drainage metagenome]|uniref:Uncharacterized protein n=1 Tax=mine drainage metagenome TaxID=410659 RepID=A0A1J5P927_9ZZZZ
MNERRTQLEKQPRKQQRLVVLRQARHEVADFEHANPLGDSGNSRRHDRIGRDQQHRGEMPRIIREILDDPFVGATLAQPRRHDDDIPPPFSGLRQQFGVQRAELRGGVGRPVVKLRVEVAFREQPGLNLGEMTEIGAQPRREVIRPESDPSARRCRIDLEEFPHPRQNVLPAMQAQHVERAVDPVANRQGQQPQREMQRLRRAGAIYQPLFELAAHHETVKLVEGREPSRPQVRRKPFRRPQGNFLQSVLHISFRRQASAAISHRSSARSLRKS